MKRYAMQQLVDWKNKPNRKPLILKGARQVGKTWLMKEFGRQHFSNVKIIDAGCFVEIWPGCEGMIHISELNTERVEKVTDIVKEGDEIIVKCLGYDKRGRLNFSRKEAIK